MAIEPDLPLPTALPEPAPPAKPAAVKAAPRAAAKPVGQGAGSGDDAPAAAKKSRKATAAVKEEAGNLRRKATDKAHALADQGKTAATDRLDGFSRLIEDAAAQVDDRLGAQYGDYARTAASTVSGFASTLRDKDVDDLVADARAFVKKSPVVAVGAAAAIGFILARLVKAGIDAADEVADGPQDTASTPGPQ